MTSDLIQKVVARHFNTPPEMMGAQSRKAANVYSRYFAMSLTRKFTGYPYKTIGSIFGARDHSTVIHGVERVEDLKNQSTSDGRKAREHWNRLFREIELLESTEERVARYERMKRPFEELKL